MDGKLIRDCAEITDPPHAQISEQECNAKSLPFNQGSLIKEGNPSTLCIKVLSEFNIPIFIESSFEDSIKSSADIKTYDEYLKMLSTLPNVKKTCNLYYSIKNDYSPRDYVDDVHLSATGQKKWAKYLKSCKS